MLWAAKTYGSLLLGEQLTELAFRPPAQLGGVDLELPTDLHRSVPVGIAGTVDKQRHEDGKPQNIDPANRTIVATKSPMRITPQPENGTASAAR